MRRTLRATIAASAVAAVAFGTFVVAPAAMAAGNIVIWTDADRAPAVRTLFAKGYKGSTVTVVVKEFGMISQQAQWDRLGTKERTELQQGQRRRAD